MPNEFCDVSLPVPLDRTFTYSLPLTLRHRVKVGARLLVPFGARKLTGVILAVHDDPPEHAAREALRLMDEEPVLDEPLLALGRWISGYYCARWAMCCGRCCRWRLRSAPGKCIR